MSIRNQIGFAIFAALLSLVSIGAHAQQDLKVGVVNFNRVYDACPQKAEAVKKFQEEFVARKETINKRQSELTALSDKYNKDALTMSSDERDAFQKKLLQKERELKWDVGVFEEDKKLRESEMTNRIKAQIFKAIQQIGQDSKYDLILIDGVIFRSERVDLSDEVLELLKKQAVAK